MATRVILVGIGGASCSGKTLLAKHLVRLLPSALLLHQDDFCPPEKDIPVHPEHGVQDWDDPPTCMDWPRLRDALRQVKTTGHIDHASNDHLNQHTEVNVDPTVAERWRKRFAQAPAVRWVLVDGFVLYWDQVVADTLDVKLMLRVPKETLRTRRDQRSYALQHTDDVAAGTVWEDPPGYFDNIVYPAYVKAHAEVFRGADVEEGDVEPDSGVVLIHPPHGEEGMTEALIEACEALLAAATEGQGHETDQL
ncbi:P-loop containing nucleoside triphosphate hydrolase protein [Cutaneotrichosporon oleaginosum]|uniref:p-loop containing nucleoside triphosphate hydrolase protein n=1 Tax=Cutaneotrichosporon oleaginosum TaxID=879819 RepID=A0A0J0XN50_9TREE|nr:P-loop containing nucleoside triphosphate hydrolase protein [Cutaneotrichosporon oleaginosum]KLT42512.1 P-loop containing nucleoside triphosphate hydrolase protein [Cutaneotrichosporon oleaginosum]TXT07784.1 hypothetical protein COLE_04708 [Cutaneotrichosporon oleaginosum]